VLGGLIILGGIGFIVIDDVKSCLWPGRAIHRRLSLQSRVALSASAVMIVVGAVAILTMEWNNVLAPLSGSGRMLAALFQSISARTAGFNTLDIGTMASETLFFLCILMFIGACPGSCGGGIKTTTLASLLVSGASHLRGISRVHDAEENIMIG
jgi:trk system potassium uptake protein TrkH